MISRHFVRLVLAILMMAAVAVPMSAQKQKRGKKKPPVVRTPTEPEMGMGEEPPPSPLVEKLKSDLAGVSLDFWTNRLNAYKTRIDGMLTPADLAEVNRLRLFWSMFIAEKRWEEIGKGFKNLFEVDESESSSETGAVKDDGLGMVDRVSEMAETFFVAKWIARRYKSQFSDLRGSLFGDVYAFADTLTAVKERFSSDHAAEISADPQAIAMLQELDVEKMREGLTKMKSEKEVGIFFTVAFDPIVMLYNGQDLRSAFKSLDMLPKEISGLSLPEQATLAANVPNPASKTTRISYMLAEPSNKTMLRIFNSRGDLMATYDQGDRPTGNFDVDADVSTLPSGTYLYQLTVQSSHGERVYSHSMQVQ